jgi:hypothetical protein
MNPMISAQKVILMNPAGHRPRLAAAAPDCRRPHPRRTAHRCARRSSNGGTGRPARATSRRSRHIGADHPPGGPRKQRKFLSHGGFGDEEIFHGILNDATGTTKAGIFAGTLTSISGHDSLNLATVDLQLPGGQITIQGFADFTPPASSTPSPAAPAATPAPRASSPSPSPPRACST